MSSLPPELDFSLNRAATPERMDEAMVYLLARIRALEAINPEFARVIEELRRVGLQKIADGILPVYNHAIAVRDALQAIRDLWEADLLPAEVVADTTAAVVALVYTQQQSDARYPLKSVTYSKGQVDAAVAARAVATAVYTKAESDARYPLIDAYALATQRLLPTGGATGQVISKTGPGANEFGWTGLPTTAWTEIAAITATSAPFAGFVNLPINYHDLLIMGENLTITGSGNGYTTLGFSADGVTWVKPAYGGPSVSGGSTLTTGTLVPNFKASFGIALNGGANNLATSPSAGSAASPAMAAWHATGGLKGLRLQMPDDIVMSGTVHLYGR